MNFNTDIPQSAGIAAEENLQQNNTAATEAVLPQRDLPHGEATALLARLTALETETPPLSEAQQTALYRRALCKAGLAGGALVDGATAQAADVEPAAFAAEAVKAELQTEDTAAGAAGTLRKGRSILWQRWALSAAAALAVMALGGMALVRGGPGASTELAVNDTAMQYSAEAAADEPMEGAVTQHDADFDALPAETAAEKSAGEAILEESVEEDAIVESTFEESFAAASGTDGNIGMGGISDGLADSSDKKETDTSTGGPVYGESRAEAPSGNTTAESAFEENSDAAGGSELSGLLLMADGRLYRGTALVLQPDFGAGARLDSIADCIEADGVPTEDGQANFAAEGAPFARWRSGLAVLLGDEWRYFEPVE